jgi:O-antigen ligase
VQKLGDLLLSWNTRFFLIFYFLFLLAYFVNTDRDQQYIVYGLLLLLSLPSLWNSRHAFASSGPLVWSCVLLFYLLLTLAWSDSGNENRIVEIVSQAALTLSFLLVTSHLVCKHPREFSAMLVAMIICVALIGLAAMVYFYSSQPFPTTRLESFGQLKNPGYVSSVNGVFAVVAGYFAITANSGLKRTVYTLAFIILVAVVMMAQARSAFIAMLTAIMVLVIWQVKSRTVRYAIMACIAAGLGVLGKPLYMRFMTTGVDLSSDLRIQIWQDVFAQISSHPFFGAGIATRMQFPTSGGVFTHPHSVYLSVTWYGGFIGLLILLATLAVSYRECIVQGRQKHDYLGLALLVYTTICVVIDYSEVITWPYEIWLQFWLAIAVASGLAMNRTLSGQSAES